MTAPLDSTRLKSAQIRRLRSRLLAWFEEHKRPLPFRDSASAYAVWVSEVMAQQTRVEVVRDYYSRWMKAFPTVKALASASEDEVLNLWQGLGYYSRARRLRSGAQAILRDFEGEMPESVEELLTIPGVGPYSAGAIASIAFGQAAPVVDGNVIRVFTRLFALKGDPTRGQLKKEIWRLAQVLVPQQSPGDFNQSVMELGALVCTPRSPSCFQCPLRRACNAYSEGQPEAYPQLPPKKAPLQLKMALILARHRGALVVSKLPGEARWWAGLHAFPFTELDALQGPEKWASRRAADFGEPGSEEPFALAPISHTVTKHKISLSPVLVTLSSRSRLPNGFKWVPRGAWGGLSLPAPHKRALSALLKHDSP